MANASGVANPDNNNKPAKTSVAFKNGKKYPVFINALPNAIAASGTDAGCGMKFKKPFRPNTKYIAAKIILKIFVIFFIFFS